MCTGAASRMTNKRHWLKEAVCTNMLFIKRIGNATVKVYWISWPQHYSKYGHVPKLSANLLSVRMLVRKNLVVC
jgi:hypothetical protein